MPCGKSMSSKESLVKLFNSLPVSPVFPSQHCPESARASHFLQQSAQLGSEKVDPSSRITSNRRFIDYEL